MNSYEAKRGFLTFISTLVIAGGIFVATYLTVNSLNLKASNRSGTALGVTDKKTETSNAPKQVSVFAALLENNQRASSDENKVLQGGETSENRVFAETETGDVLISGNAKTNKPVVLGGTYVPGESTSGAVPVTGSNFISGILLLGGSFILLGSYLGTRKARHFALRSFEKKVSKEI